MSAAPMLLYASAYPGLRAIARSKCGSASDTRPAEASETAYEFCARSSASLSASAFCHSTIAAGCRPFSVRSAATSNCW